MADDNTCNWPGASGKTYTFYWFKLPQSMKEVDGNYIYAKLVKNEWVPIYIGEGCLKDRCSDGHHKAKEIAAKMATHIHAHINENEKERLAEEKDLLKAFPCAYAPDGCNDKIGG